MQTEIVDRRELGARLHMLRWMRDWSAKRVADQTGISEATLLRWERGKGERYPNAEGIGKLAILYEVNVSDLLAPNTQLPTRRDVGTGDEEDLAA